MSDWREEIRGYCVCFTRPFDEQYITCPNPAKTLTFKTGCPAYHLRKCLLAKEAPGKVEFVLALLRTGCFTKRQLHTAVQDVYQVSYAHAMGRVQDCLQNVKHRKVDRTKIVVDDAHRYVLIDT